MSRGQWAVLLGTFAGVVALGLVVIVGTWLNAMNRRRRAEDAAALARAVTDAKALAATARAQADEAARAAALASWSAQPDPTVYPLPDQTEWLDAVERAGFPPPVEMPGDDGGRPPGHPQAWG